MKFCIIGAGRFGYETAVTLAENGMEVLAIDSNSSIIDSIKDRVTHAICMKLTDEESLRSVGIESMDTVIVSMGEKFAESILLTAILKRKLNIKNVITRSISQIHKDILKLVGADQVILPEYEAGQMLAERLSFPFNTIAKIAQNTLITQTNIPEQFINLKLNQINFQKNYNISFIGIKNIDDIKIVNNDYNFKKGDIIVIAGSVEDIKKFNNI
jgi:trk system potassium uptake protein TrkA